MRGPHNILRLIQTGATFQRTGAMGVVLNAVDAPPSVSLTVICRLWMRDSKSR